jgi:hypothetical protein
MTKINVKDVGFTPYITPHCSIVEIYSEGLLCQSGGIGNIEHDGITGDDSDIF